MNESLIKYPRTPHIEGSRRQAGDQNLKTVKWASLKGRYLVVEEKIDGANSAISFSAHGELRLQSRGHYLTGGGREHHFSLFKTWANTHARALHDVLNSRFIMFGEWVYAKHTIYYDNLPHYFLEFDIFDREEDRFLSTTVRRQLLNGLPVASVPVLAQETVCTNDRLGAMIGPSCFKTPLWRQHLSDEANEQDLDITQVRQQTDPLDLSEGLYVKWEDDQWVRGRYKYVRDSFLQSVIASEEHWLNRSILPNRLAESVDIFAETL